MTLRRIPADAFVRRIKQVLDTEDKRFAFFLGAGCSISSGIPGAGSLVRNVWLPKLRDLNAPERTDLNTWATEAFAGYDARLPALLYGELIDALFPHPAERQREIERLCDGKFPAFGYAVLARMMEINGGKFKVVLTTNFDDLIADALYLYTSTRPLIIPHEFLARFIRPTRTRPLVVKLHGDHRLSPQNTSAETDRLKGDISRQVRNILHDRGLIIIGYAGNDQGIRTMLDGLPSEALPLGIYWVSGTEPDCALREWLERRGAVWVEHGDFDQLMLLFRDVLDLRHPDEKRFEAVFRNYRDTYQKLSGRIVALPVTAPSSAALKDAVERADSGFSDWFSAYLTAERLTATDPERADATYRAGLEQFPASPELMEMYALFLYEIQAQYDEAEQYFLRAVALDPRDADLLGEYAKFLASARKDSERAEVYYRRAVEAEPQDANNLGNYAHFLANVRKDVDRAEEYHQRAVEADPQHANNLGNYAVFLACVRNDADHAEEYYRRAVEADPQHANSLGNYASLLAFVRNDADRAEEYYRRAVEADPQHANSLGNYAFFLANVRNDADRAEEYYRRAVEADPQNAIILGNYAGFLLARERDEDERELLDTALSFVVNDTLRVELLFYYLALHGLGNGSQFAEMKQLLLAGARSRGWNLAPHVERARQSDAAFGARLEKLSSVISDGAALSVLDDWPEWQQA
ncbi:MAG: hypothetical protein JWM27_952 [Gemmatimonadetes bacterium]|nr:hypothetical protein [Gemmatimonadota bacterium]